MSSEEKIKIQITLLNELANREAPFTQANDKTVFLRDFYQRCGVSKLYHQLIADFFHNNIQRGSCPKWARDSQELYDQFIKVKDMYGACLPPIRPRKKSTPRDFTTQLSELASGSPVAETPPKKRRATKVEELKVDHDDHETDVSAWSNMDFINNLCKNISNLEGNEEDNSSLQDETGQDLAVDENESSNQEAPEEEEGDPLQHLQLNIQRQLASAAAVANLNNPATITKADVLRMNRKLSEINRGVKKIAMDQEAYGKDMREMKQTMMLFMSAVAGSLNIPLPTDTTPVRDNHNGMPAKKEGSLDSSYPNETAAPLENGEMNGTEDIFDADRKSTVGVDVMSFHST